MTSILPYLDQAEAYNRVDFDRPWTDERNTAAFKTVIEEYICPTAPDDISPRPTDGYADTHYAANSRLLKPNSMSGVHEPPDGAAQTILIGQVAVGVQPWGSPENVRDPAAGLAATPTQFSSRSVGLMQFLMCDGSVKVVTEMVDPIVLERSPAQNAPMHSAQNPLVACLVSNEAVLCRTSSDRGFQPRLE